MPATELLYQSDSYLREFDAVVVDVQDNNLSSIARPSFRAAVARCRIVER